MSTKSEFTEAAGQILTESQLDRIMMAHNIIYESSDIAQDKEMQSLLENMSEDEFSSLLESLDEKDRCALMEAGALLRGGIWLASKLLPKAFKAGRQFKKLGKGVRKANKYSAKGNTAKASKYTKEAGEEVTKLDRTLRSMPKEQQAKVLADLEKKDPELFKALKEGRATDKDLHVFKQQKFDALKKRQTELGDKAVKANEDALAKERQINELKMKRDMEINSNSTKGYTKKKRLKEEEDKINEKYKKDIDSLENEKKTLEASRDAANAELKSVNSELGTYKTQILDDEAVMFDNSRINIAGSANTQNASGLGQFFSMFSNGANAGNAAASAAATVGKGVAKKAGKKILGKLTKLSLAICGIDLIKNILEEHDIHVGDILVKGLAMLSAGYVGSKAAEKFVSDSTESRAIGAVSGALLMLVIINLLDKSPEEAKTEVDKIANMQPAQQKSLLQSLGIVNNQDFMSQIAADNNVDFGKLVSFATKFGNVA